MPYTVVSYCVGYRREEEGMPARWDDVGTRYSAVQHVEFPLPRWRPAPRIVVGTDIVFNPSQGYPTHLR